ncbi:unnamed protein product [Rotaria sordida]|uniref:Uncharacterized protein n=1 Tax=Rotaria sordida TaxID=392033 RepID=A0A814J7A2_9BILA|nr:unnamed protein product [Rotaria sordida]CAF1168268.1 unnamed protein product [Rotaria sordida]
MSFTKFVSYILKFIVNDYGLEALSKSSEIDNRFNYMLNLIDLVPLVLDENKNGLPLPSQGIIQIITQHSCVPQTPLYQLFHQRIQSLADNVKQILMEIQMKKRGSKI